MNKRVFIIHGWDGYPEEGWFPWLKRELEAREFYVQVPQMPDAGKPMIQNWVPAISEIVENSDPQTYFVGHSMGCQAIVRYIESLPGGVRVGGAIFVAGFFKRLTGLEDDLETQEIRRHWLETSLNLERAESHLNKSVAIFSDNDPFVPLDNQDDFREKLNSQIIIEHSMGHFSGSSDNVTELSIVLEKLLEIAR